MLDFS
jgi:hypothetical protein